MRSFSTKASDGFFTATFGWLTRTAFDVTRYAGVFIVAAGLVAAFGALHYLFGLVLGSDAARLLPDQRPLGWATYEHIWTRVATIDRLYHRGQLPPDTRLGIVVGVSSAQTGIERRILDANETAANRWIVLTGTGASFENMEKVMRPVFLCRLKPAVVVLCVHTQMLVGEPYATEEPLGKTQAVVGRSRRAIESNLLLSTFLRVLKAHWVIRHQAIVAHFLRERIYEFRLCVFRAVGVHAEALSRPAPEPWDDEPLFWWHLDRGEGEAFALRQLGYWWTCGHFEAKNYHPDGPQARCLVRMVQAFRDLGAEVKIVIMPLRSPLRRRVPRQAKTCLFDVLDRAFPDDPPPVFDLEKEIPDRFFSDEVHFSSRGAERLSKLVVERLQGKRRNGINAPAPASP
ncbi:MAG TPA: hypothetical protein VGX78_08625 [Pirellulales bacterium]|nr:hypothetical protein [Pirellulales bacterium]